MSVSAQTVKQKQKDLTEVKKQIDQKKQALKQAQDQAKHILKSIQKMDQKKEKLQTQLKKAKQSVQKSDERIQATTQDIQALQESITKQKEFMKAHLRHLYQNGPEESLSSLSTGDSGAQRKYRVWMKALLEKEKEKVLEFEQSRLALAQKQTSLEQEKLKKQREVKKISANRRLLGAEQKKKKIFLTQVNSQKSLYQQNLKELEGASKKIERLIKTLKSMSSKNKGKSMFERSKGLLHYPVSGKVLKKYGSYSDQTLQTKVHHKGIDFFAPAGQSVRSVFQGEVVYADWFEGYGKVVIVDHGGHYFSLYAHLSTIVVKLKDKIQPSQVIAKSGDTGSLKGPYLYFELRKKGVTINPTPWFE